MPTITIAHLFDRLELRGLGSYGLSKVTQLEHALQCAALADQTNLGDKMVIAALFHDIGHLVAEADIDLASQGIDDQHEQASADVLKPLFGEAVSEPVRLHVASKRYLCTTEPDYYNKLSEDSITSLELQGGLMSATELAEFESCAYSRDGVELRRIDDQAKKPDIQVPSLSSYRELANQVAAQI